MKKSKIIFTAGMLVILITTSFSTNTIAAVPGDLIWNNGDPDFVEGPCCQRIGTVSECNLADDFHLSEEYTIEGVYWETVDDSTYVWSGYADLIVYAFTGSGPGAEIVALYEVVSTRTLLGTQFSRDWYGYEIDLLGQGEEFTLSAGDYYILLRPYSDGTDGQSFWMTSPAPAGSTSQIYMKSDYFGFTTWTLGYDIFGNAYDVNFKIYGTSTSAHVVTLYAGQDIPVGTVTVWNDEENLYVKYQTTGDWYLTGTHLHIATDLDDIPMTKKGNPIPGQFDWQMTHDYLQVYTYILSWADDLEIDPTSVDDLCIAAHANVKNTAEIIGYTTVSEQLYLSNGYGADSGPETVGLYSVNLTAEGAVLELIYGYVDEDFTTVAHIGATSDGETIYVIGETSGHLGVYSVSSGLFEDLGYISGYPGGVIQVAVSPDDQLFVVSQQTEELYTVDVSGPSMTLVGNTGINVQGADIAFDADGVLYLYSSNLGSLYTVNTLTGVATLVGYTGVTITGLAIRDGGTGDLVGSDTGNNEIITIDKNTGALVIAGTYPMKKDDGFGTLVEFEHGWGDMTVGILSDPIYREETAWGDGINFVYEKNPKAKDTNPNWGMYFWYEIMYEEPPV